MATGSHRRRRGKQQPGWAGLRADLARSFKRFSRSTSDQHKLFVLAVIGLGAVLRILRMSEAVTYDEALAYVHYAGRSLGFLFSDHLYSGNHVLYAACARLGTALFGANAWGLRLPALVAGILVLPLCYAFVRSVFNRHIAVLLLCLVAVSGPLVEYSAMARGYSMVWLFTIAGFLAARHYVSTENLVSAFLLALCCALGIWATPEMAYAAVMVYAWAFFMLVANYQSTARRRMLKLAASAVVAGMLVLLCYAPVVIAHSLDQLLHHPAAEERTWARFVSTHQDRAFDLWAYFTGTASTLLAFAGVVAVVYAAYVSLKYRLMLFALAIGSVPLVIIRMEVAPPAVWTFSLLVLHLGSAIGLFYLLKVIRDKLAPSFDKPKRTLAGGLFLLLLFGWLGVRGEGDAVVRFPEARQAAAWLNDHAGPGDRACVQLPWDAPLAFYLEGTGKRKALLEGPPVPDGKVYVLVAPAHGQTVQGVLLDNKLRPDEVPALVLAASWDRLELFSSP